MSPCPLQSALTEKAAEGALADSIPAEAQLSGFIQVPN